MRKAVSFLFLAGALFCASCSSQQKGPQVASSSGQAGYAERYPDELAAARGKFSERESKARDSMSKCSGYPDELDKPNWDDVGKVVELADDAGKSQAYVDRVHETETV